MFFHGTFLPWVRRAGAWLFVPALAVVAWGELSPHPPKLADEIFLWDKAEHFLAFYALTGLGVAAFPRRNLFVVAALLSAFGAFIQSS